MNSSVKPLKNVSIIGCGDIGCLVAQLLLKDAHLITGYARSEASITRMAELCIGSTVFDLDSLSSEKSNSLTQFKNQLVFYFAPPPANGTRDNRMRAWLDALDKKNLPQRILYISTTGVYGDQQGRRVDETTPVNPQADRAMRRLDAEQALTQFSIKHAVEFIILRVSGIYGQDRLPRKRLLARTPILRPEVSPITNRIHEDDLAQICVAAALNSPSGEIYNVSDGDNMTMSEYFIQVAEYLKLPQPPLISWYEAESLLSEGMLSYLKESRIVDNKKILHQLGITLIYPSLQSFFNLYSEK